MLFCSVQRLKIHGKSLQVVYEGHTINSVTEYKYFETVIDTHLTIIDNSDKVYEKASIGLQLLLRLRLSLTIEAACNVYSMMIVPLITCSMTHRIPHTYTQYNAKLESLSIRMSSIIEFNYNLP